MNANTYEQTLDLVVGEFGKQTKAKIYEWIDANAIVVKDRKNKTKEDLYKVIATFKMQTPAVVSNDAEPNWGKCEQCDCEDKEKLAEYWWNETAGKKWTLCEDCGIAEEQERVEAVADNGEYDEDDGFEDCNVCGYAHYYEDKCPNETTCEHYEKSEKAEEEDENEEEEEEHICPGCENVINKNEESFEYEWAFDITEHIHICKKCFDADELDLIEYNLCSLSEEEKNAKDIFSRIRM